MFPKFSLREPAEAALAEHVAQVCLRPGELGGRKRGEVLVGEVRTRHWGCMGLKLITNAGICRIDVRQEMKD